MHKNQEAEIGDHMYKDWKKALPVSLRGVVEVPSMSALRQGSDVVFRSMGGAVVISTTVSRVPVSSSSLRRSGVSGDLTDVIMDDAGGQEEQADDLELGADARSGDAAGGMTPPRGGKSDLQRLMNSGSRYALGSLLMQRSTPSPSVPLLVSNHCPCYVKLGQRVFW